MKAIVGWSGGKDSQASLIWAVETYGANNVEAVYCNVKWDHRVTENHIYLIPQLLSVKLVIISSDKYNGLIDLAKQKGRFPSAKARFCTEELKIKPMINYILDQKESLIIIQGIRSDESESRSQMLKECTYFKYYFEPYQTNSMIIEKYDNKGSNLTEKQLQSYNKAKHRLSIGKEDAKYHTYRKSDVIEWLKNNGADVIRPVFEWNAQDVINYSLDRGLPLNPLYYKGMLRVGCWPCVMCSKSEAKEIVINDRDRVDEIRKAEVEVGGSFFAPDYVPPRYRRQESVKGDKYNNIDDVVDYIKDKNATGDLFAEIEKEENHASGHRCMSYYGLCE